MNQRTSTTHNVERSSAEKSDALESSDSFLNENTWVVDYQLLSLTIPNDHQAPNPQLQRKPLEVMRLHINKDNKASSWQNCHISKMILGEFENFTQGPGGPAWLVSHEVAIAMVPQKAQ